MLRILEVAVCMIGDVCCMPTPDHQQFPSHSLGPSVPDEACSTNASGTVGPDMYPIYCCLRI